MKPTFHHIETLPTTKDQLAEGKMYLALVDTRSRKYGAQYIWVAAVAQFIIGKWYIRDRGIGFFDLDNVKEIHELVISESGIQT